MGVMMRNFWMRFNMLDRNLFSFPGMIIPGGKENKLGGMFFLFVICWCRWIFLAAELGFI